MHVKDLEGEALDREIAKIICLDNISPRHGSSKYFSPSADIRHAWPLLVGEKIGVFYDPFLSKWRATHPRLGHHIHASPLVAGMRCWLELKVGPTLIRTLTP
jgi:hypothetical protein